MRCRAFPSLLLLSLALTGLTRTAVAQMAYHPLEVGKKPEKPKPKPEKLTVWSAKPASLALLAPEQPLFGWSLRPPQGFVYTQKSDAHNQFYIFQGHPRADNTAPVMWVILGDVKSDHGRRPTAGEVLDLFMQQINQNRQSSKIISTGLGSLHGRRFIRRRWSATEATEGASFSLHGTVYLTVVGAQFAAVAYQAADPGAGPDLASMETSALSFHKR